MSTLDCIEVILRKTGVAMSVAELLPLMRESGEWTCDNSKPENSIRTQINVDIARKGEKSRFCRPKRGRFALRTSASESAPTPVSQPAKRPADDLGFFYILVNASFAGKWVKVLTSYKPIAPDGDEINDPAVPLSYEVFSAYKTHRFSSVRTALFGLLIGEEKNVGVEPHDGFFRVCPTRAHQLMASVAESFGETQGIYVATAKPKEFELRKPHPPPADGSTEIYVGNLSYVTTEDELKDAFSKYGAVTSVRIVTNRFNGKSKGFGFVRMRERSDAERACSALCGQEIGGRKLKANIAKNVAITGNEVNALYCDLGRGLGMKT